MAAETLRAESCSLLAVKVSIAEMTSILDRMLESLLNGPLHERVIGVCAVVGMLFIVHNIIHVVKSVYVTFLRPGKNLQEYGRWAIVTGATDGIGKGFAIQLAKKKINVVLISRTPEKLRELAGELETKYAIQTKIVALDYTDPDVEAGMTRVEKEIAGLEIGILVNNAGMSYPYAQFFHELSSETIVHLIRVNIEVTTRLTHLVIPQMIQRRKGAVINIGSGAATVLPSDPLYAVYAGTKG